MMIGTLAPALTNPTAINSADPAKTNSESAIVAGIETPLVIAAAPKMIPKGNAPITSGIVALTAARNSARGVLCSLKTRSP